MQPTFTDNPTGSRPSWVGAFRTAERRLDDVVRAWSSSYTSARILVLDAAGAPDGWIQVDQTAGWDRPRLTQAVAERVLGDAAPVASSAATPGAPGGRDQALTVVIPTRERPVELQRCLRALAVSLDVSSSVIVVENGRLTDATEAVVGLVADETGLDVRRIEEDRAGTSSARNAGAGAATTDIVAFLDDDTVVDRGWGAAVAAGFASDPDVGVLTGMVPPGELESPLQQAFERRVHWNDRFEPCRFASSMRAELGPTFPYAAGVYGTSANMAVRRSLFEEVGGFRTTLGGGTRSRGGEDLELFVRSIRHGATLLYQPSAIAWHVHRTDTGAYRRQLFTYGSGLTAYLTAVAFECPPGELAHSVAAGAVNLVKSRHRRARAEPDGGSTWTRSELAGMAFGPVAHVWDRMAERSRRRHPAPIGTG